MLETALRRSDAERAAESARAEALARNLDEQRAAARCRQGAARRHLPGAGRRGAPGQPEGFPAPRQRAVRRRARGDRAGGRGAHEAQQKAIEGMVAPVRASLEKVDEQIRAMEVERGTAYGALSPADAGDGGDAGEAARRDRHPGERAEGAGGARPLGRDPAAAGGGDGRHAGALRFRAAGDGRRRRRPAAPRHGGAAAGRTQHRRRRQGAARRLPGSARGARTRRRGRRSCASTPNQVLAHVNKLSAKSYWEGFAVPTGARA